VVADVLDRKVSASAARDLYGVVLDAAGRVDAEATTERRRALAAAASGEPELFERGVRGLGVELADSRPGGAHP
jgi:hypothetical protein